MTTYSGTEIDPRIERTRKVVLEATADLIAEVGYDNVTIEGVSERCGVARSTIYRHWSGKEELIVEAIKNRLLPGPEIDTGSVRSDAITFLQDLAGWFVTSEGVMVVLSLLTAAHRDPVMRKLHRDATRAGRDRLARIIEKGIDRGELPAAINPTEAANDLIGPFFYKKMVLHEDVDLVYAEDRVSRWLAQVGWEEDPAR
jgi:AcrR family transcriptional regulator